MKTQTQTQAKKPEGGVVGRSHLSVSRRKAPDTASDFSPEADLENFALHPESYSLANISIFAQSLENNQRNRTDGLTNKLPIQAKLTIGQPNDKYEQEADRVAQQVVQRINRPKLLQSSQEETIQWGKFFSEEENKIQKKLLVQRKTTGFISAAPMLEDSVQQARGGGEPLEKSIREPMEQVFGANFSQVKIHADAQSDRLNQIFSSRAFTLKTDIFFRQNHFNSKTQEGQRLIAHELTHVLQQTGKETNKKDNSADKVSVNSVKNHTLAKQNSLNKNRTQSKKTDVTSLSTGISKNSLTKESTLQFAPYDATFLILALSTYLNKNPNPALNKMLLEIQANMAVSKAFPKMMKIRNYAVTHNIKELIPDESLQEGKVGKYEDFDVADQELTPDHQPAANLMYAIRNMKISVRQIDKKGKPVKSFSLAVFILGDQMYKWEASKGICMLLHASRHSRTRTYGQGSKTVKARALKKIRELIKEEVEVTNNNPLHELTDLEKKNFRDVAKAHIKTVLTDELTSDHNTIDNIYRVGVSKLLQDRIAKAKKEVRKKNKNSWSSDVIE